MNSCQTVIGANKHNSCTLLATNPKPKYSLVFPTYIWQEWLLMFISILYSTVVIPSLCSRCCLVLLCSNESFWLPSWQKNKRNQLHTHHVIFLLFVYLARLQTWNVVYLNLDKHCIWFIVILDNYVPYWDVPMNVIILIFLNFLNIFILLYFISFYFFLSASLQPSKLLHHLTNLHLA